MMVFSSTGGELNRAERSGPPFRAFRHSAGRVVARAVAALSVPGLGTRALAPGLGTELGTVSVVLVLALLLELIPLAVWSVIAPPFWHLPFRAGPQFQQWRPLLTQTQPTQGPQCMVSAVIAVRCTK